MNDDIIAALVSTLETGKKVDARTIWKPAVSKPVISEIQTTQRKPVVKATSTKAWAQGLLFDISVFVEPEPTISKSKSTPTPRSPPNRPPNFTPPKATASSTASRAVYATGCE